MFGNDERASPARRPEVTVFAACMDRSNGRLEGPEMTDRPRSSSARRALDAEQTGVADEARSAFSRSCRAISTGSPVSTIFAAQVRLRAEPIGSPLR